VHRPARAAESMEDDTMRQPLFEEGAVALDELAPAAESSLASAEDEDRGDGAKRLQAWWRGFQQRRLTDKMRAVLQAKLMEMQSKSVQIGSRRVQPWSQESAELALKELGGKVGSNGMILWPKGTVEKLLMERTKYKDVVAQNKKAAAEAKKAAARAAETAK